MSALMNQEPPDLTQSGPNAEHGHKRTLSSPGSQPLVKRSRVIGGINPSLNMDIDDSAPFSSVDELLNIHQTPYDPARPIIVTVPEEVDHLGPYDGLGKPTSSSYTSPDLLPPGLPVSNGTSDVLPTIVDVPMISGGVDPSALSLNPMIDNGILMPEQSHNHMTVAPSDISKSGDIFRRSPHLDTSPVQAPVPDNTMDTLQSSEEEILYEGEREFIVTLPFASSQRPQYVDIVNQYKAQNMEYSAIIAAQEVNTPPASLVHQIDEEFVTLLDLCDYPHVLADKSLGGLSEKEIQHYAVESNAKFNFLWEFLHEMRNIDKNILIVARSKRLLQLLKTVILIEKISVSTSTLDEADHSRATSASTVVLAHASAEIQDPLTSFHVVIGFDYIFRASAAARQIEAMDIHKQPFVLILMMLHSIEHLDISMTWDHNVWEHKNSVIHGLIKGRDIVQTPNLNYHEKPHEIAFHFAEQIKDPNPHFIWDSQPIPKEIIDSVYASLSSSQASSAEPKPELKPLASRKRKMTDDINESVKRPKLVRTPSGPFYLLVDADRHTAIKPFVSIMGLSVLDDSNPWDSQEIHVPQRLLNKMVEKTVEDRRLLEKERGAVADLRNTVSSMSKYIKDYGVTMSLETQRLRESIEERSKFQIERDVFAKESESLKTEITRLKEHLAASETREKALTEKIVSLKALPPSDDPNTAAAAASVALEAATRVETTEAQLAASEKRLASQTKEMDFFRQTYQDVSNTARDLKSENQALTAALAAAQKSASENLLRIHDTNMKNQVEQLMRMVEEARTVQKEREVDLERLREELKVYKNGRRETRQSSTPRSPRVGIMSPRNVGFRAAAASSSRGTSPVTTNLDAGYGNGRWGHLKD